MKAEQLTSLGVTRNNFYNLQAYNQGASKNSPIVRDADGNKRRDVAAISPAQRATSMIQALQKQKQSILEAKKDLVHENNRAGRDIEEIKSQLESYNELLNNLDEQIAKVMTDIATEEANKLEELQEKLKEKAEQQSQSELPKTEDEIFAEKMGNIAEADAGVDEAQRLSSVKRMTSSRSAIVKSEIEFDESLSGAAPAAGKRSELRRLNQYINSLDKDITRTIKAVNSSIDKIQEDKEVIRDKDKDQVEDTPVLDTAAPPSPEEKEPDTENTVEE